MANRIGMDASRFLDDIEKWQSTATYEARASADASGWMHWAWIAAKNYGVLEGVEWTTNPRTMRDETHGAYPLQSLTSAIRGGICAPDDGEVIAYIDIKSSHWQIMAMRSGDPNLIRDVKSGDIYTTCFGAVSGWDAASTDEEKDKARKATKIAMNAWINGGGINAVAKIMDNAEAMLSAIRHAMDTMYPAAKVWLEALAADALTAGYADPSKPYAGGGVGLMRIESECIKAGIDAVEGRCKVILPMRDGVLISAPRYEIQAVARDLAARVVGEIHGQPCVDPAPWIDVKISTRWGGGTDTPIIGMTACRAEGVRQLDAIKAWSTGDDVPGLGGVVYAVTYHREDVEAIIKTLGPRSKLRIALISAINASDAAMKWKRHKVDGVLAVKPTLLGISRIIAEDPKLPHPRLNTRSMDVEINGQDMSVSAIANTYMPRLESTYGWDRQSQDTLLQALAMAAEKDQYDPIKDWFDALPPWDGVPRISRWLQTYAGAEDMPLLRAYARKWAISVVARTYQPGCKVDTGLILIGGQGTAKTTFLSAIAPAKSCISMKIDPDDKDKVRTAARYAIVEWAEMSGGSKQEQNSLKAYMTTQHDVLRPPYGRKDVTYPRRGVIVVTSNEVEVLRDETGSRRWWPVMTTTWDIEAVKRDRDQIGAEALAAYRAGEQWWLTDEEEEWRKIQAGDHVVLSSFGEGVKAYLMSTTGGVSISDILAHLGIKPSCPGYGLAKTQIGKDLAKLGMIKKHTRGGNVWVDGPLPLAPRGLAPLSSSDLDDMLN
jgi:hypothetical protein